MVRVPKVMVERIPLELIDAPDTPLRESMDMEKIRELAESIRERGLQQPIIVTKRGERYEVVSGHRRFLAHRILEAGRIEAIVREVPREEMLLARAVENLQREDLTPMETARVYAAIRDGKGMSIEGVARTIGKNKMTVWKYLQLLELPEDFQKAIDGGMLSMAAAVVLMKIDDEPSRNYYLRNAVEHGITEAVAMLWVQDYEKTREGRYYQESQGGGIPGGNIPVPPTYVACACCYQPVDVRVMKHLTVCESCHGLITQPKVQEG